MWRMPAMAVLVVAKLLAGHEEVHPVEMLWETIEILGIFIAGIHASHQMRHKKEDK